jgi:hypothetical protein
VQLSVLASLWQINFGKINLYPDIRGSILNTKSDQRKSNRRKTVTDTSR